MNAVRSGYFDPNPLKKDARTSLGILGLLLGAAGIVLVLQSIVYASSIPLLWETGQNIWGETLSLVLQILAIWAAVLGILFAVRFVTQPVLKYGSDFWSAVLTGFPLGLVLPFLLSLGLGAILYIPLGLLSLLVTDVFPYATLQFAWLAAAYLVFLWIVVGMPPLLGAVFLMRRWYYKLIAVLLFVQLTLDILQTGMSALQILVRNSVWQTDNVALILGLFGSLLVSIAAVLLTVRRQPALTVVYMITGIWLASVVTGNFSDRLFAWGEFPSAVLAVLAPLFYLQVALWILRKDGTALAALAAGYIGLLTGLLVDSLLELRITGHGWISLLWGVIVVLGIGLALGYFLGRRVTRALATRFRLLPLLLKYMDLGLVAGIMAGMFIGGFLAR